MFEIAVSALLEVLKFPNLLSSLVGVLFGLFVGSIPGLTVSLGMVLMLPITYTMAPVTSFSLLLGMFCAGMSGGSISAILLISPELPRLRQQLLTVMPWPEKDRLQRQSVRQSPLRSSAGW